MAFNFKKMLGSESADEDYVEIDFESSEPQETKVQVKPFILRKYEDINDVLNSLREGYTIAIVDIKPLKSKDIIELKRAVSKIKKTVDALEGSIAGFGEHTIIATPQFAEITKTQDTQEKKKDKPDFING